MFCVVLICFTVFLLCGANAVDFGRHHIFEILAEVPAGWIQNGPAPKTQKVDLRFVLAQPRIYEFEQLALDIATPNHPLYGQHLTKEEVDTFTRPTDDTISKVTAWLHASGFASDDVVIQGSLMGVTANISRVEGLLQTKFHQYNNGNKTIVRALQYSLPVSLHEHILLVQPTTHFVQIRPQYYSVEDSVPATIPPDPGVSWDSTCKQLVTPVCLRAQYGLNNYLLTRYDNNKLGVSGYLDQYASRSDLTKFIDTFSYFPGDWNFTYWSIDGGQDIQNSPLNSEEANLDIQYATAMALNQTVHFYSTAGRGPLVPDLDQPYVEYVRNEPYFEQLVYLLSLPDGELPTVLSTSYGEDEQAIPLNYANVTCNMFAQLGARGVSVIFASGDTGVGSGCQTNDGHKTTRFLPTFPASCPWVTSVGGTHGRGPEVAVAFSSGGFSDVFARPSWQDAAVSGYLNKLGDRWKGLYNPQGRGIPDVAARSVRCLFYDHGNLRSADGTSCAAPVFASFVTFLNSLRIRYGLSSLGFLNPFLYSAPSALHDITLGGSSGCQGTDMFSGLPAPIVPYASWNATEGWDPVTGLGSPITDYLVKAMIELTFPKNLTGGT